MLEDKSYLLRTEMADYYHGGNAGLKVGDYILPASKTGARSCSDSFFPARSVHRNDRCYVTTHPDAALMFASLNPQPRIYVVEPEDLSNDPDCSEPGLSYECSRAKIIKVIKPHTKRMLMVRRRLLKSFGYTGGW